jgi:hypothetical protein
MSGHQGLFHESDKLLVFSSCLLNSAVVLAVGRDHVVFVGLELPLLLEKRTHVSILDASMKNLYFIELFPSIFVHKLVRPKRIELFFPSDISRRRTTSPPGRILNLRLP